MSRVFKAALAYFAVIFGVGFLLGMIRVPFLLPRLGERLAELIELPLMIISIIFAARWIVDRYDLAGKTAPALSVGILATILLLSVEFSVVLFIRRMTVSEFLAARDPVAGTLYYFAVAIFAAMPASLSFWRSKNE